MEKKYIEYDYSFLKERNLKWKGWHLPYNSDLKDRAKYMRANMTSAEEKIWQFVKGNRVGTKVLR